jgi:hypothetical protein
MLLATGARKDIKDFDGKTPTDIIKELPSDRHDPGGDFNSETAARRFQK